MPFSVCGNSRDLRRSLRDIKRRFLQSSRPLDDSNRHKTVTTPDHVAPASLSDVARASRAAYFFAGAYIRSSSSWKPTARGVDSRGLEALVGRQWRHDRQ